MNLSITGEFLIVIIVNVLCGGIYLGSLVGAIKFIEAQIERLERKQDLHNNAIMRIFKLEERADGHDRRLDELHDDVKDLRGV